MVGTTLRVFAHPTYVFPSLRAKRRVRHSPQGDGGSNPESGRKSGLFRRLRLLAMTARERLPEN
jgi:hypothetical protein